MGFVEAIERVNGFLNSIVWGPYAIALLVGTGVFFTLRLKLFQISRLGLWCKSTFGALGKNARKDADSANITPFQAVSTALASTVGTGNVVGVATAIVAGGPGAIFWMWVSAFFGMMTKYAEIVLAVKYREKSPQGEYYGGPMYYIEKGLGKKWLAVLFAALGALACFGIGNMVQVHSVATTLQSSLGAEPLVVGIAVAALTFLVIFGGIKRIATVTEKLVPVMAVFYIIGGLIVIIANTRLLPGAFAEIFESAFSLSSAGGGVMGYTMAGAMKFGFARGVFTNEAGMGSASIAHAASNTKEPVKQGMWGIFEVFVDTILICTITALVIIMSGLHTGGALEGAPLTMAAYAATLGGFSDAFVSVAMVCFALATIIGWSYYGERCVAYLFNGSKAADTVYKLVYVAVAVVGAVGGLQLVWSVSDTLNGMMALPNLVALLALNGVVVAATRDFFKRGGRRDASGGIKRGAWSTKWRYK